MGTRNLTVVIKDNKIKLSQYGQWDGYFRHTGVKFVNFIRNNLIHGNIEHFGECVDLLKNVTDSEYEKKIKSIYLRANKNEKYHFPFRLILPQFSRDTGIDILDIIYGLQPYEFEDKKYPIYIDLDEQGYCEFVYIINLDEKEIYMLTSHDFDKSQVKETCQIVEENYKNWQCWYKCKFDELPDTEVISEYYKSLEL